MSKFWYNRNRFSLLILAAAFLALLAGCEGDTGPAGPAGPSGMDAPTVSVPIANLTAADMADLTMTGQITGVTIASPPVVRFWVKDQYGRGLSGLGDKPTTTLSNMRFALAKLVPGTQGSPSNWVTYTGLTSATSRPSTENNGTIVDNGDGSYTYTFTTNVSTAPANAWETVYEPSRTHRMVIQISGTIASSGYALANPMDIIYDWVPAGGAVTTKREITMTEACNSCHGAIGTTTPHGGRVDTRYCVVCHNDQRRIGRTVSTPSTTGLLTGSTYVVNGEALGNFPVMIHKIHMGANLNFQGYNYAGVLFNDVHYPQDVINCRKCHQQSATAPQGDNWKNIPNRRACGACHDNIDFSLLVSNATHSAHTGGAQTNDFLCSGCHDASEVEAFHLTVNATQNNPNVAAGLINFTYEISSVTVTNTTQPLIKFRILADDPADAIAAAPVTFPTSTSACGTLLTGFTGSPSFQMSYALPQDGISTPADYNNLGKVAGQPSSVSITNICNASQGVLTGPDGSGYYTAQITSAAGGFPSGSKMRAVGLQGYFTQVAPAAARHTISVVKAVTGATNDAVRRSVVDNTKCGGCHEWFEGHGGNRVYDTAICVQCHIPNLSSSGRGADPANVGATDAAAMTADGYDPTDPFAVPKWPEAAQNFKDLIHRTHASGVRDNEFRFVRDRGTSGVFYYNFSHIHFPGIINMCETCHKPGTYDATLPSGVLASVEITGGDGLATRAAVTGARATVPNLTDVVTSPFVATCVGCHDSALAVSHMGQNGATNTLLVDRATYSANVQNETCILCHGAGRVADTAVVHIVK